jgi:hypothetical protein
MRTLPELFKILKANKHIIISKYSTGLCALTHRLQSDNIITSEEEYEMKKYIDINRPKLGSKYYNESYKESPWYWPLFKWYPRLLWINTQIRELEAKDKLKDIINNPKKDSNLKAGTGKSHKIAKLNKKK